MRDKFTEVVDYFGSKGALSKALGVSPAAVSRWVRKKSFPPARAIDIELLTDGKFIATDLVNKGAKDDD